MTASGRGPFVSGGTNWPHPLAPPLGRPPPPPPPTRPLAPPLSQHPPPLPPPRPPTFQPPPSFPPQFTAPLPTTSQQSASLPPPLPPPPLPPPPPSSSQPPPPPPENAEPTPPEPQKSESTTTTDLKDKTSPSTSGGFEKVEFKPMSGGGLLGKRSSGPTISMKIGASKAAPEPKKPKPKAKKPALVSQAFGNDSDEEEEMPPEAKLRMRNIGKNTPTSSGPNSFYKGKMGFSDPRAGYKRYSEDD